MIQVGKTYEFKTLSFYYIGTVTEIFPTHARINNVTQVFETGPNAEFYRGHVKVHERMPDGVCVPTTGQVVIVPHTGFIV